MSYTAASWKNTHVRRRAPGGLEPDAESGLGEAGRRAPQSAALRHTRTRAGRGSTGSLVACAWSGSTGSLIACAWIGCAGRAPHEWLVLADQPAAAALPTRKVPRICPRPEGFRRIIY